MTATLEAVSGARASNEGSRAGSAPQRTNLASREPTFERVSSRSTLELDTVATLWQRALDAAGAAVTAAGGRAGLPTAELRRRSRLLAAERQETAALLARLAAVTGTRPAPWLSAVPITRPMLGLGDSVRACLFDLDGVLTNSDVLHATAWAEVFDDFLLRQSHAGGWHFTPFDVESDYGGYVGGRTRLEGIHAFLESRGLHVPEGRPGDSRERDTAYGLAKRKSEALGRALQRHTVEPPPSARRYLEAAGRVGVARVVVSASASTTLILESAGLDTVVDAFVDADVIRTESLRSPPAPDLLLAACRRVGVQPADAVAFTESPAELAAARTAGIDVVGIGDGAERDVLIGFGAQRTSPSLGSLLDRRLLEARP